MLTRTAAAIVALALGGCTKSRSARPLRRAQREPIGGLQRLQRRPAPGRLGGHEQPAEPQLPRRLDRGEPRLGRVRGDAGPVPDVPRIGLRRRRRGGLVHLGQLPHQAERARVLRDLPRRPQRAAAPGERRRRHPRLPIRPSATTATTCPGRSPRPITSPARPSSPSPGWPRRAASRSPGTPASRTCANVYCHVSQTPTWGALPSSIARDSCHGTPPASHAAWGREPARGRSPLDVAAVCSRCHPVPAPGAAPMPGDDLRQRQHRRRHRLQHLPRARRHRGAAGLARWIDRSLRARGGRARGAPRRRLWRVASDMVVACSTCHTVPARR